MTTLAMIAHDEKKKDIILFSQQHMDFLKTLSLVATGTTGSLIEAVLTKNIKKFASGPLGGDAQIAAQIVEGKIDAVIFLVDPMSAHAHDPDIHGLLRICMVYNIPVALNLSTANILISSLKNSEK